MACNLPPVSQWGLGPPGCHPLSLIPCPLHVAHTYPTELGCGPASAPCLGSSSSAGIQPCVGCMTSSPAVPPCPLLLAWTGPRKPPLGLIYSLLCQRPKASERTISSPLSPLQTLGRVGACLLSALYLPRRQLALGMPLAGNLICPDSN